MSPAPSCERRLRLLLDKARVLLGDFLALRRELLDARATRGKLLDARVQFRQARAERLALGLHLVEFLVLATQALGYLSGASHLLFRVRKLRAQVHKRFLGACGARSAGSKAPLHHGERVRWGCPRARPRCEQARRDIGGVAQAAQLVAGEREHGRERLAIDIVHEGGVALEAFCIAASGKLDLAAFAIVEEQRARAVCCLRLVGVAHPARLFPTEEHPADE